MRRPSSRKRQPASCVMFSCASPENDEMIRSDASTRSTIARSTGPGASDNSISATRSSMARHASGEKRSRMTEAAARAVLTRPGSEPSNFVVGQHRARHHLRRAAGVDGRCAPVLQQAGDRRDNRRGGVAGIGDAVEQRAHQPQGRFGAFDITADPEQIVGGAARQHAGGALDRRPAPAPAAASRRTPGHPTAPRHRRSASPPCRLMARASGLSAMRTKPPGITCQPSPTLAR